MKKNKNFSQLFSAFATTALVFTASSSIAEEQSKQLNPQDHDEHHIEEVIVTGVLNKTQSNTALPVNVLTEDELIENASSTIGETINSTLGVHSASFGVGVGQPIIRGQGANRVQVLQNGTGALDVSNSSQDHANTVEGLLADRIEIIRGPATLLYGNGAIGGVVNVIDRRIPTEVPEEFNGALEYRYNTGDSGSTLVSKVDGGSNNFAWYADLLWQDTDDVDIPGASLLEDEHEEHDEEHEGEEHEEEGTFGFLGNSNSEKLAFTVGSSYITDTGFIGVSVNQFESEYGLPPGVHGHEEEHEEEHDDEHEGEEEEIIRLDLEQTRIDVKAGLDLTGRTQGAFDDLTVSLTSNNYTHTELEGEEIGTVFDNEGLEFRANVSHSGMDDALKGAFGVQYINREFSAIGEEAFIPMSDISSFGAYLIESVERGAFVYEAGLRLDKQTVSTVFGCSTKGTSFSSSLGTIWNFSKDSNLLLSFNRSQREPSVEELNSNIGDGCAAPANPEEWVEHAATGRIEVGNPSLGEETALNIELAYRKHSGRYRGEAAVFYNRINDYIYLADVDEFEETIVSRYLQDDARFLGAEVKLDIPLVQWSDDQYFDLHLFSDYVEAELTNGANDGFYLPRIPPLRAGFELSYAQTDWRVKLKNTWVAEQEKTYFNEDHTDSYNRLDFYADYHLHTANNDYLFFVKIKNITDEDIRNHVSFLKNFAPEPGRSFEFGVRYQF